MRLRTAPFFLSALVSLTGCEPRIAPIDPPDPQSLDAALVARGAALAAIGNCRGCHTPRDGAPFSGGVPMHSPFGIVYSTNITPEPETGIGRWSLEAFRRAMRQGIRNDGKHLYPAFPYDRFTRVTDDDNRALYAFLMSQPPVRHRPPANDLTFPFNIRAGVAVWNWLFLREGPQPADVSRGVPAARGEYLVEGLAHCGSCHSTRNLLFAEKRGRAYEGGDLEGWHAYAINSSNSSPIPWDAPALAFYLRTGYHPQHGISRGTMGLVTSELADAPEAELGAIAAYVVSMMGPVSDVRRQRAQMLTRDPLVTKPGAARDEGAVIYETTCLPCHDGRRPVPFGGIPLSLSLGLNGESPRNLINVVVHGLNPAPDDTTPMMPGFARAMNDEQIEALVKWLRANLSAQPPWKDIAKLIKESREMTPDMLLYPPGGKAVEP